MKKQNIFKDVMANYASASNPEWKRLAPRSKVIYEAGMRALARFADTPVDQITRPMIIELRDDLYDTPGVLRPALSVLSNILRYAHDRGMVPYNQAINLRGLPPKKPIEPWTDVEIERFLHTAPPRLALAVTLALYTGQRRSDLVRMMWSDYDGDTISVTQQKTKAKLVIPVHKNLKVVLDAFRDPKSKPVDRHSRKTLVKRQFILTNAHGDPWSGDSLRNAINHHCRKVGIEGRSIHGLRKVAAVKLAEAGCSPHQIMAITGHQSLNMVELYTKGVSQARLAREAMRAWI